MISTRLSQHVAAPRARVYQALIDPQAVATWMVPDGMTSHVEAFDARVGGSFRVTLTYDAADAVGKTTARTDTYHGKFVELVPNEKLVELLEFESADDSMRGQMRITFLLSDAGGGTEVLGVHENLPRGLSPADNEKGWQMALRKLATLVETSSRCPPGVPDGD